MDMFTILASACNAKLNMLRIEPIKSPPVINPITTRQKDKHISKIIPVLIFFIDNLNFS